MSHILPLQNTPLSTVVSAFTASFVDYLVQLPSDVGYWERRFKAARVDWNLSFGVFENSELVAFIIQGIDDFQGHRTAYNTGTGVLPSHRGRGLVDALYAHAFPLLRAESVTRCALTVITENARAIRVYERIGFRIERRVCCYRGSLAASTADVQVQPVSIEILMAAALPGRLLDSWDNTDQAILALGSDYHGYRVAYDGHEIGYFVAQPSSHYVPRLEVTAENGPANWDLVLAGLAQVCPTPKLNDLDEGRFDLRMALLRAGLAHAIDQFEMAMEI